MSSVRMGRRRASDVDMADGRYALERLLEPRRWKRRRFEADPKQISRRTPHVVCRRRRPADPAIEFGKPLSYRSWLGSSSLTQTRTSRERRFSTRCVRRGYQWGQELALVIAIPASAARGSGNTGFRAGPLRKERCALPSARKSDETMRAAAARVLMECDGHSARRRKCPWPRARDDRTRKSASRRR